MISPLLNQLALAQQQGFAIAQQQAHPQSIIGELQYMASMAALGCSWPYSSWIDKMEDDLKDYLNDWDK